MPIARWSALILCIAAALPARAAPKPASVADVVVTGKLEKPSAWKRAESEHVVITSDGSEAELRRVSRNLELLYRLLSHIYRRGGGPDDTVKLHVTLFNSQADLLAMRLRNLRWQEGPYLPGFSGQTYYDPREDGEVLAVARSDQQVNLNTVRAFNLDCDDFHANANADADDALALCTNTSHTPTVPWHDPFITTWEEMLYARFAQHFLLTYDPQPYPRWYLDGIGALFSTIQIGRDGSIDYGEPPAQFRQVFRSFGDLNVADVLTGRYLDAASGKSGWTPAHAWLLAHYFLFSDIKPERSAQLQRYMAAIREGVPVAEAAKVFGNLARLQIDIRRQVDADALYSHASPPQTPIGDPLITALSPASAALIEARLELDAPLTAPEAGGAAATATAWLAQARNAAEKRSDTDTILFAAEAECRTGHYDACLAEAERVLAAAPDNVDALAWKGTALTDRAIAGPVAERAQALAAARKPIERAIQIDADAPLPLIAWFRSFADAGEPVPDEAMRGMAEVVRRIPAAPAPRLYLARELVRQGKTELARRLLSPVLYGPYESPEKTAAGMLFTSGGGAPHAGG